jgi:ABC-2 type transport system permease protein
VRSLTGLGRLVRLVLRRDRVRLTVWVVAIIGVVVVSAAGLIGLYPDQESIDAYVRLFGDNPALVTFAGPGHGFDDPNLGVVLVNETQLWGSVAIALMGIFLLNRHTRAEEESERAELVLSGVVGAHAPTAAATAVVATAQVLIGVACAVAFVLLDYPVAGSVALAASMTAVGLVFVGVTAVAAQVFGTGRATLGVSSALLALAFVVRAAGDVGGNLLTWASPIGWAQAVRAFADERWWTLALCLVTAAGLTITAFALAARRDLGAGMLPTRAGPAGAPAWVGHPVGLAFRLQRTALVGWLVGLFLTGLVYGSIADDVDTMVEDNPQLADVFARLEGGLTDSYLATSLTMLSLLAGGFAVSSVLALRSEESAAPGRGRPSVSSQFGRPGSSWARIRRKLPSGSSVVFARFRLTCRFT